MKCNGEEERLAMINIQMIVIATAYGQSAVCSLVCQSRDGGLWKVLCAKDEEVPEGEPELKACLGCR